MDLVKVGLSDENIRLGHRLALFQRAQKICNAVSNKKLKKRWSEFSEDVMACVHDSPKVSGHTSSILHIVKLLILLGHMYFNYGQVLYSMLYNAEYWDQWIGKLRAHLDIMEQTCH